MTRARRDQRWREQAARLISSAIGADFSPEIGARWRASWTFNVDRVRAYCERLLSEADDLDQQREVFADWTRARGLGPENREAGAFVEIRHRACGLCMRWMCSSGVHETCENPCDHPWHACIDCLRKMADEPSAPFHDDAVSTLADHERLYRGGWPGLLAREYVTEQAAKRRCPRKDCDGGVLVGNLADNVTAALAESPTVHWLDVGGVTYTARAHTRSDITITSTAAGRVGVACPECETFKSTRPSLAFVNGGNMRAAAQRLLDTLDGKCPWNPDAKPQPIECTHCSYAIEFGGDGVGTARPGRGYVNAGVLRSDIEARPYHAPGETVALRECPVCEGTGKPRGYLPPLPEETTRRLTRRRPQRVQMVDPRDVEIVVGGQRFEARSLWRGEPVETTRRVLSGSGIPVPHAYTVTIEPPNEP